MVKRAILLFVLAFYAVSALAASPWAAASMMTHGGPAQVVAHDDCDGSGAAAPAADAAHDDGCGDCARGFSPCCTAMFALAPDGARPAAPATAYDRPQPAAVLHPAHRGESIYRPPRA
jgi:hypothetical protein